MSANVIKIKTKIKAGSVGRGKFKEKKNPKIQPLYGIGIIQPLYGIIPL